MRWREVSNKHFLETMFVRPSLKLLKKSNNNSYGTKVF
ncbi:unnamed protein product [Tenebrio molitor]|nr:unnamed protein product [Tenebrio molitor]